MKLGWEGYGIFWALIELLRDQTDHSMQTDYDSIAYALQSNSDIIKSVINDFNLFEVSEGFFYSNSLFDRMKIKQERSEKARESANKRWNKDNYANALQSHSEPNAIKEKKGKEIKEIKGNEIKEKKESSFFSLDEILLKFEKNEMLKRPYFNRMAELHSLPDSKIKEHFKKWALLKEGTPMTLGHAENSFNIYLGNLKPEKTTATKQQGRNIFSELLQEENAKTKNQ